MICDRCGKTIPDDSKFCPQCGRSAPRPAKERNPAVWKLVSGIISIVQFSSVIGIAIYEQYALGLLAACLILAGGIVSIVTRNSKVRTSNLVLVILFGLSSFMCFGCDLLFLWALWCFACGVVALFCYIPGISW